GNARLNDPWGVAVDNIGTVYVSDQGANLIRQVSIYTGLISTVAGGGPIAENLGDGGPATGKPLINPFGGAGAGGCKLYIADSGRHSVRQAYPLLLSATASPAVGAAAAISVTGGSGSGAVSLAQTSGSSNCSLNASSGALTLTNAGTCGFTAA